jgi:hypothetical protein
MSIFGKIKDAILGKKAAAAEPAPAAPATTAAPAAPQPVPAAPAAISEVDVEAILTAQNAYATQPLNWRTSIVDLMKLLEIDPSLQNRKELAQELGYTGELNGSAEMNIWLHKAVMRELAANGGMVPADLTD